MGKKFVLQIPGKEEPKVDPYEEDDLYYIDESDESLDIYYVVRTCDGEIVGITRNKSKADVFCRRWNKTIGRRAIVAPKREIKIPDKRFFVAEFENKTLKIVREVFSFKFGVIEHKKNYHVYRIKANSVKEATDIAYKLHLKYYSQRVTELRKLHSYGLTDEEIDEVIELQEEKIEIQD